MKFTTLAVFVSALSAVAAAPMPDTTPSNSPHQLFKRKSCPSYYRYKGVCNGTSCRWGLINYRCERGSCVGNGGGDGSCCGWPNGGSPAICPNGGF
ncbi:uncharacterized protein CTRU02_208280 [Colletotrichum truncatum]|uniref:Uncharacterized protein n=1 Tax=Colletotrichum truncatum TaxID=5467 RepID=A0ACC3YVU2_COLTU|nr:uncharacterized protein CTRU02_07541 [Colletotrichum truncatum]KAF6791201.1 hypothetical protein CTRU02_07541 [Colletotrichum truncatum]